MLLTLRSLWEAGAQGTSAQAIGAHSSGFAALDTVPNGDLAYPGQTSSRLVTGAGTYSTAYTKTPNARGMTMTIGVKSGVVVTLRRAISLFGGFRRQLTSSELGTGIKPLVLLGGILKLRATTEGTPVVFVSGKYKTLSANETLEI